MKHKLIALLIALVLAALLIIACGPDDEWIEWQTDVLERQQENDIPAPELDDLNGRPVAPGTGVQAASFAWGG